MKRTDISRLKGNYHFYFKIGLIISISLVILAFQWTSTAPKYVAVESTDFYEPDIEVIRTVFEKPKQLIPVKLKPSELLIAEDKDFIEELLPDKLESVLSVSVDQDAEQDRPEFKIPVQAELPEEEEKKIEPIFDVAEEMPRFKGCEEMVGSSKDKEKCATQLLLKYIYSRISYPKAARETGIEGTVVVRFVVEQNGTISNIQLVKDIGGGCGQQVLKLVENMPDWIPGKQRGNTVRVQFSLPVNYTLN